MSVTKILPILVLGLAVNTAEAAVSAPQSSAEATIDWSSFSVVGYAMGPNPAPTITWSNEFTSINTSGDSLFSSQYDNSNDWTSSLNVTAGNNTSTADSAMLHSYATDGFSYGSRNGEFSVTGNGILVFSYDYSLAVNIDQNGSGYANAGTNMGVSTQFGSNISNQYFSASDYVYLPSYNLNNFPLQNANTSSFQKSDTLYLAVVVKDGEQYDFNADVNAQASNYTVPLPASAWMFMSALVGFIGLSRRKVGLSA